MPDADQSMIEHENFNLAPEGEGPNRHVRDRNNTFNRHTSAIDRLCVTPYEEASASGALRRRLDTLGVVYTLHSSAGGGATVSHPV